MDKTERLFSLLDRLRRRRTPVSAETLAEEEGVSVRTIYRDVQTLIGLGAPIEGEAGLGYVLRAGFFLPPLMFSSSELEALVLGARWVQTLADADLTDAAKNALAKIAAASPPTLRGRIEDPGLWPVNIGGSPEPLPILPMAREAMREEKAIALAYQDVSGERTERTVWPIQLAYYEGKQILVAWCCLREAYRNFRTDRILQMTWIGAPYGRPRRQMAAEWLEEFRAQHAPVEKNE
jgi:predicted DNA-binding transcriptional regulator YafY